MLSVPRTCLGVKDPLQNEVVTLNTVLDGTAVIPNIVSKPIFKGDSKQDFPKLVRGGKVCEDSFAMVFFPCYVTSR